MRGGLFLLCIWVLLARGGELPRRLQPPGPYGKPGILLILAQDVGYGDLSCYGQNKFQTPNLDRLAAEGTRFTECYAGSPLPGASLAVLLSGRHTGWNEFWGKSDAVVHLPGPAVADYLKNCGYSTAFFGVWGFGEPQTGNEPFRKGFSQSFGYYAPADYHSLFPKFLWRNDMKWPLPGNQTDTPKDFAPHWITRVATNYLKANREFPFFLVLCYPLPQVNEQWSADAARAPGYSAGIFDAMKWPAPEKYKASLILQLDAAVGRLRECLEEFKISRTTIIIFASLGGPAKAEGVSPDFFNSAGPWRGGQGELYEGGLRVPAIVSWPGVVPAGRVSRQRWAFWDLAPTLMDVAVGETLKESDGISMLPEWRGREQTNRHDWLYWELPGGRQALLNEEWKLLRHGNNKTWELYNLKSDPGETNNLAMRETARVATMEALVRNARRQR